MSTENTHTVLVVDDHPLFRKGVVQLLAMDAGIRVVGEAGNKAEALRLAAQHDPDLILLDLNLKGESGIDILAALKEEDPSRRVVMLTVSDAPEDLIGAIRAGADGYLLKDMEPEELCARIKQSVGGNVVLDASVAGLLAHALNAPPAASHSDLTEREREILGLLADGRSNKEIARELGISDATVKVHIKHLLRKLNMKSRLEAAVWALQNPQFRKMMAG